MLDIKNLQSLCNDNTVLLTKHSKDRCIERKIKFDDIKSVILNGEIIEQYEDDTPFPSCLILGLSINNKYLHIVVSCDDSYIYVITAYYPDALKWCDDFKTRRRVIQ